MPGFAVAQARDGQFEAPDAGAWDDAPTSFLGAAQAAWDDGWQTRNMGVRENRLRRELWTRRAAIERATGQTLKPSYLMAPANDPNAVSEEDFERQVEDLRAKYPAQLANIETRAALMARLDADLRAVRARADKAAADQPIGAFLGGSAAAITDVPNLLATAATAPFTGGTSIAGRVLFQGVLNAGIEGAQVPARAADAQVAGPEYGAQEAAFDVAAGFAGGAAIQGLVIEPLAYGARRLFPQLADPAARAAAQKLDQAARDDQAIGPVDGLTHEEGLDALTRLQPKPTPPPARELGELFTETAGATGEAEYYGRRILQGRFDPRALETDAATFQYKADADAEGVTARLRGVEVWDPTSSGKVIVFERADGTQVIADGHQRRGLALRMDEKGWDARLDGYLFREADGWTARQVRTIAALKNIREGSGTILDAAKVFRDAPESLNDRSLPVTGDFISQARALARLSPEAFGAVVNKVIPERYAAEIGAMAGNRPDLHPGLVKLVKQADPANLDETRALISEAMLDDWVKAEGEQADFFGDLPPESTTIARAKVKAAVVGALRKDARIYGQLVKNADAIEAGGNVLLRDANETAAAINRTALEVLARLSLRSGEVGEAMAAAAREVLAGKKPGAAAKGIVQMVKNRLAAGEQLEGLRLTTLDPEAPSPVAEQLLADVDDPKAWAAQAVEAPEDAAEPPPAGLFDDLDEPGDAERARARLAACAPVEAAE